jgi:hypothetical protein
MIKSKIISVLSLAVFSSAALLTGVASAATPAAVNKPVVNQTIKKERKDFLKAHPELAKELKAIKDLPKDQRKAKMADLKKKYPDFFKFARSGKKENKGNKLAELTKNNPQAAAELQSIRNLPKEQRKAKMKEFREKYLKAKK